VVGWLRIGATHPNLEANFGPGGHRAITKAAILASDPFVNYAAFDLNANGSIQRSELHVTVIVAGHETSYGGSLNSCGNSIWGHNWALFGAEVPTVDGKQVGSDAAGGGYNQFGERHCWSGDPGNDHLATIGIMVHEMGHDLNLPDLYDTDGASEGIGEWSVMASGSWTFTGSNHEGSSPVHPDAFSKWYEGWLTPLQITDSQPGVSLTQMATNADVVQLLDNPGTPRPIDWTFQQNSGTGEYFLVENRQLSGYDAGLPGCGVLIWHIDETRSSDNDANANEARKLVDLEEADGLNHLDNQVNRGDPGDPYRGPRVFNAASNPNSNLYSGAPSEVAVTNISSSCATTMSADMAVGSPSSFQLDVSKSGTGTGTVTSSPAGINCGVDCSHEYSQGTDVTLTATPTGGSRFAGWSGACSGTGTCLVDMVVARSVTASFTGPTTTTLSVTKTSTKVKARGSVLPAHPGEDVRVTLYKKRSNGTWRKITTKTDLLNSSSAYAATFTRPSAGRCKITSLFAADGDHLGSKATKQFRC
jgi:M6 family metalloprotease-like protein